MLKSIGQLLLYEFVTSVLDPKVVYNLDLDGWPILGDSLERLKLSDRLLDLKDKEAKTNREAASWFLAEAITYETISCVFLEGKTLKYLHSKKGWCFKNLNRSDLNNSLNRQTAYEIRHGATLVEEPGSHIRVDYPTGDSYLTTLTYCDCTDYSLHFSCSHLSLVKTFIKNRTLFSSMLKGKLLV